jgi:hypothetical protein
MSFAQLIQAWVCASVYPRSAAVAGATHTNIVAFLTANGEQSFTDTNSGLESTFVLSGAFPGWKVIPG